MAHQNPVMAVRTTRDLDRWRRTGPTEPRHRRLASPGGPVTTIRSATPAIMPRACAAVPVTGWAAGPQHRSPPGAGRIPRVAGRRSTSCGRPIGKIYVTAIDCADRAGRVRRLPSAAAVHAGYHDPPPPPPPPPPEKPPPLKALPPEPDPVVATQLFAVVAKWCMAEK